MIKFLFKTALWVALLAGGSALAVNMIPALKANILEIVNPQVKEQRLVRELQQSLNELVTTIPTAGGTAASIIAKNKAVVEKSQALLQQIAAISSPSDSLVSNIISGVVGKVADTILGTPPPTPSLPTGSINSPQASSPLPSVAASVPCVPVH